MHPLVLASLGLWALNDHVFKPWFANAWTGKLSDVACLVVVPVLLPAAWEWCTGRTDRRALMGCAVGAALVMAAINVWEPAARVYEVGLGVVQWPFRALFALGTGGGLAPLREVALTRDPTDLLTLPAAAVPLLLERAALSANRA